MLTATDADNHTTTYTYTSWGDVATATNADGKVTTYNYDSSSHLLNSTSVDGSTVATYTYYTHQRVRTATGADGITQTYDYNDANQVTKITYPDSTTEQFSYDCSCGSPSEHITKYTDRAGNESTFAYDANGNRTSATDANGTTVNFAYNGNDQLNTVTDGNGHSTEWLYDALGRATQKIFADGSYEKYFYDSIGQISQQRMANGTLVNFTYDNRGNVTKIDYPIMADVSYTYTNLNQVATMTDGIGTTTYGYDTMGRLTSVDGPWSGDTITYSYDALGRRSEVNLNGNVTYYDYDSLSRLSSVTHGGDTFGYAYNGASGQLNHVTLPNGTKSTFSYDSLGRLSSVQDKVTSSSANISQFTYGYDNRDMQTSVQRALGTASAQTVNYTYDNIGQLTGETSTETTPLVDNSYTYDDAGNRLTSSTDGTESTFTLDQMNQISSYTFGGNAVNVDYDANGNTTQLGFQSMTYDDADRLTSVVQKNPLTGDNVKKMEYEYDGLSRKRVSTTYTWNAGTTSWDQQDARHFIYDGMDLIQERDGSNNVIASYVRDGNIGGVLSRTTSNGTFYYHYDGNGNVVAMTNTSGAIVAQYTYDAYGNITSMSGTEAASNPIRFSTKYFDSNTGYYDFGFRSYDPITGRWLNRDPLGESGGLNLYGFVGNSPGNAVDGYGLNPLADIERWQWDKIAAGGLKKAGWNMSAYLLKHSLSDDPCDVNVGPGNWMTNKIANSKSYKSKINEITKQALSSGKHITSGSANLTFGSGDLMGALHGTILKYQVKVFHNTGRVEVYSKIEDFYNFDNSVSKLFRSKSFKEAGAAYVATQAQLHQNLGIIGTYNIGIRMPLIKR